MCCSSVANRHSDRSTRELERTRLRAVWNRRSVAPPSYVVLLLLAALGAQGCRRERRTKEAPERAQLSQQKRPQPTHDAGPKKPPKRPEKNTARFGPTGQVVDGLKNGLGDAPVVKYASVGHTSIVFHAELREHEDAALKPDTHRHPGGYRAEIAAYRLAQLLAIDNVPPAARIMIERDQLREKLVTRSGEDAREIEGSIRWLEHDPHDIAPAAAVLWIPNLTSIGLDTQRGIETWAQWLAQEQKVEEDDRALAKDISNMVLFDYLIGNWDRFSGGNVQVNEEKKRLIIRDHNLAFKSPLPQRLHAKMLRPLFRAERFSRTSIMKLKQLDRPSLDKAVVEVGERSLLSDQQRADIMDRRAAILSRVTALVELYGENSVLAFE